MWLSYKAVKCVHAVYALKYKDKNHPAYIRFSKNASRKVKKAKIDFERKLTKNIKKDSKSFFCLCTRKILTIGAI